MENILNISTVTKAASNEKALVDFFSKQRADFDSVPFPELKTRKDRIERARSALIQYRDKIVEAINEDFGKRPRMVSLLSDVLVPVRAMKHASANVAKWMKPERRAPDFPLGLIGARAYVQYQPLGVVGVMAPWNAPAALCMTPLAGILAAGNRALIKPSEFTEATSSVIREMIAVTFAPEEVAVVTGGVDTAKAFAALPFDHLIFTGGAKVARSVMRAASENLTPVTLELGGKSPAIVAKGADIQSAAESIVNGKLTNSGQICMAPDYALVWRPYLQEFRKSAEKAIQKFYPIELNGKDLAGLVGSSAHERCDALIEDARANGADIDTISVSQSAVSTNTSCPPSLVTGPKVSTRLMREEIFGPILPIVPFDTIDNALDIINELDKPLAAYLFGGSKEERRKIIREAPAGGMTIDDVMLHPFLQNLPFGGVGESGMGRYLGHDGFKTFSNAKAVMHRPWLNVGKYLHPPYTKKMEQMLEKAIEL
jgi:coniferyl-aldehyde dehydrogenase